MSPSPSPRSSPLRRQLLLLAVAGMFPLALLAVAGIAYDFQQNTEDAHQRALETTRALATAVDGEIDRSFAALRVLATSEAFDRGDVSAMDSVARRAVASQPGWRFVTVAELSGRQIVNTFFKPGDALPDRQRETASFDRVVQTGEPQVGALVNGRSGWAYPVRWPVVREGRIRYVLTAVANPAAVQEIVTRQRVSDERVVSVFDSEGVRMARSKSTEKLIGTRGHESLRQMLASGKPEGTGITTTLEGDEVFTAFTRLRGSGWSVVMGLPVAAVQAPAWQSLAITSAVTALSLIVGLASALVLARRVNEPMARLRNAARGVGRGEAPALAASGVREIDDVAQALGTAATELDKAEHERAELLRREREARAQAEAANRAKDEFLAMLGHELRNPLAALSSASALLEMDRNDAAARTKLHEIVRRQVGNLARLTDDLLDTARALLGKIELRRKPVDLAQVARSALNSLALTGRATGHRIEEHFEPAWVLGDDVRLEQVACNLLVNATKYTPPGKRIVIATRRIDGASELVVEDEGQGIPPDLAERAFDLFVQGERRLAREQGGLGIGLTLVRSLVELHGGRVSLRSEGEGTGSRFCVSLPAIDAPREAPPSSSAPGAPRCRVLIVEDNADARETLAVLLGALGHEVHAAADGPGALERAKAVAFDVALLDVGLPAMDGYEVARRLRSEVKHPITLVALTGYGTPEDRARALAAGFDAHLTKPLDVARLDEIVAQRCPERVA